MTLILDDFDGASPDRTWTALKETATVSTTGGQGTTNAAFATAIHRPDGDTGSADMFAEVDLPAGFADADRTFGVMTRVASGATATGYALFLNDQGNRYEFLRYAANTATTITGHVAFTVTTPTRMRLESEGDQHRVYIGTWTDEASKPAPVATYTNAVITSGSLAAITTYNSGAVLRFDNFRAGSLADLNPGGPVTFDGSVRAVAAGSGALAAARPLAGAVAATGAVSGSLARARPLAADSAATAAVAPAALPVTRGLAGSTGAVSAASGSLSVLGGGQFAGSSSAVSALTGALVVARPLDGTVRAASGHDAALLVQDPGADTFGGESRAVSALAGTLVVARALAGAAVAESGHDAALNVIGFPPPIDDPLPPRSQGWRPTIGYLADMRLVRSP